MKQNQHTTSSESKTTPHDVVRWAMELRHLHARIAPYFARASAPPSFSLVSARHSKFRGTQKWLATG